MIKPIKDNELSASSSTCDACGMPSINGGIRLQKYDSKNKIDIKLCSECIKGMIQVLEQIK